MKFNQFVKTVCIVFINLVVVLFISACSGSKEPEQESYNWENVQIAGGGFVPGIIFHPTEAGLRYCRTDMGGAYRWSDSLDRWIPLLDWLSYEDVNLMGVESIALDPSDPDRVYLACGTYTHPSVPNGAVLRSDDRGKSFDRVDMPFKMGGNENGRGNGERMAVDPNKGSIIYLGTRHDGLWRSNDHGRAWEKIKSFPDVSEKGQDERNDNSWYNRNKGSGVVFVVFDPRSGTQGKASSDIYVGVSLMNRANLFRSMDGGKTWEPVPDHPRQYRPNHGELAADGNLYVSYGDDPGPRHMDNGGVWKYNTNNEKWTEITPDQPQPEKDLGFGYAAVDVDPQNPNRVITTSFHRPGSVGGNDIFYSTDGGDSWIPIFGSGGTFDFSKAPYVKHTPIHWMFDVEINPHNPDHAMFVTGYGGYETFDLTNAAEEKPTLWQVMSTGIEETVALDLLSPPEGAPIITAIGDYGGFVHWDIDQPVSEGNFDNPHFGNTNSVDCAWQNPEIIVRVGIASHHTGSAHIGYSLDRE